MFGEIAPRLKTIESVPVVKKKEEAIELRIQTLEKLVNLLLEERNKQCLEK